jgi:hypothetical protein
MRSGYSILDAGYSMPAYREQILDTGYLMLDKDKGRLLGHTLATIEYRVSSIEYRFV